MSVSADKIASKSFSIGDYLDHQEDRFKNHLEYMNPQLPRVLHTIGFDKRYVRGEGPYLWDAEGCRYLDFLSGYGVFNLGRYHPVVMQTMRDMLDAQDANLVQMDCPHLTGELAKALVQASPGGERVYFTSTGAETVETAIKFAKAHTGRDRFLFLDHAFHGLTVGALSVQGNAEFRNGFGALLQHCDAVPMNDLAALEKALAAGDVAGFIFEPVQGKGVYLPEPGYLKAAKTLCEQYGTLAIADEVQAGMGRTGTLFACEHDGVEPDLILISKALSGGLVPTGAVIGKTDIFMSVFSSMERCVVHSSTFGKNSFSAAMGLASLWVLQNENLMDRARHIGERIIGGIQAMLPRFEMLAEVRGRGCMIGIEFQAPRSMKLRMGWSLIHKLDRGLFPQLITIPLLRDHGILTQTSGHNQDIIKLLPPMVLSDADVDEFLTAFEEVMVQLHRFPGAVWDLGKNLAAAALRQTGRG